MFKKIKEFFFGKPAVKETPIEVAPYKIPAPAETLVAAASLAPVEIIPAGIEATIAAPVKKPRKPKAPTAPAVAPVASKPAARSTTAKKPASVSGTTKSKKA